MGINRVTIASIGVVLIYPYVIFSLVKKCHILLRNYQKMSNNISIHYRYLSFWELLFNRPPVFEVCPNHEVTKPWTGTSPDLGSVAYCYVAILYAPPCIIYLATQCPPKGSTKSCPSSPAITGHPVCTCTVSSTHPGVPCLRPSIPKSLRLPYRFLHKVLRSPEILLSLSVFRIPPSPLAPQCRNFLLPTPDLTTTDVFLSPRPIHRKKLFYSSPCLHQGS